VDTDDEDGWPDHRAAGSEYPCLPSPADPTLPIDDRKPRMRYRLGSVRPLLLAIVAATLTTGFALTLPAADAAVGDGSPTDPNISFVGRWDTTNPGAYVPYWAGAYLTTGFTGTTVKLRQRNTIDLYASIDGGPDVYRTNVSATVDLTPTHLAPGNHTLRVSYRVVAGSYNGDAVFQGLILDSGAHTFAPPVPSRLVEFIGDSITVGTTTSENALTAYGWLIGERLGVRHTQIAQGGACLVATSDGCVGLETQFLKLNPNAATPNWDFSRYQANAVVINLGTNDVGHGVSTTQFQASYLNLMHEIRARYPGAAIFALETFSKRFAAQTQSDVTAMTNAGDRNTFYVNTEGWLTSADLTDSVHPNDNGHRIIADHLAPIISARLGGTTPSPSASPSATPSRTPSISPTASDVPPTPSRTPSATPSRSATPSAPASSGPGSCAVGYAVTSSWPGGFQGDVTITNTGPTAVTGWALRWSFADGQQVSQWWNATVTQAGAAVTATNAAYNASVPAGGSAAFGFIASDNSANTVPTAFTLNAVACARR
jgi:lysophospholipase L1-like esterase